MSGYTSPIYNSVKAATATSSYQFTDGSDAGFGCEKRDWQENPYGSSRPRFMEDGGFSLIPRNEWVDRLEAMETEKATLTDLHKYYKIPIKSQASTPHCWSFGTASSFELARARAGLPYIEFSPDSVAGPINNYRQKGGWGDSAVDYITKHGILPVSQWPYQWTRSDKYEDKALRAEHKCFESYDLIDNRMNREERWSVYVTALLLGFAGNPAFNHWGHLVCGTQPLAKNGRITDGLILNSWGENYGSGGFGIMYGAKAVPDDVQVIRVSSQ